MNDLDNVKSQNLSEASSDGLLEPAHDGDHATLVDGEAEAGGVLVVEAGRPRADDAPVDWVVLELDELEGAEQGSARIPTASARILTLCPRPRPRPRAPA
jgi:hypothetical protein